MSRYRYRIAGVERELADFVVRTSASRGWQGRLSMRWSREMARFVIYARRNSCSTRSALNGVYRFRATVRKALEALPDSDPRRRIAAEVTHHMPAPPTFLRGTTDPLSERLEMFGLEAARLAGRGWRNWKVVLGNKWAAEREIMASKAPTTQKNYISRYRDALREAFAARGLGEDILRGALEVVHYDPELTARVNRQYTKRVRNQVRNLQLIEHWKELVEVFTTFLDSDNPRLILIGLMGVTGRRFYEVCARGSFERKVTGRGRARKVLHFSGQAKTRGQDGTRANYNIPILAPAASVCDAFSRLQSSPEGRRWRKMTSKELNARVNNQINRYLREHPDIRRLWPVGAFISSRCLRALYAEVAYRLFAPAKMAKSPYFAQILGHGADDLTTSLSYMDYVLDADDEEAARQEIQSLIDATAAPTKGEKALDKPHRQLRVQTSQPQSGEQAKDKHHG